MKLLHSPPYVPALGLAAEVPGHLGVKTSSLPTRSQYKLASLALLNILTSKLLSPQPDRRKKAFKLNLNPAFHNYLLYGLYKRASRDVCQSLSSEFRFCPSSRVPLPQPPIISEEKTKLRRIAVAKGSLLSQRVGAPAPGSSSAYGVSLLQEDSSVQGRENAIPTPIHVLRPLQLVGEGLPQGLLTKYTDQDRNNRRTPLDRYLWTLSAFDLNGRGVGRLQQEPAKASMPGWISKDMKDLPPSRTCDFHQIRLSTEFYMYPYVSMRSSMEFCLLTLKLSILSWCRIPRFYGFLLCYRGRPQSHNVSKRGGHREVFYYFVSNFVKNSILSLPRYEQKSGAAPQLYTPFVLRTLVDSELRSRRNQTFDGPALFYAPLYPERKLSFAPLGARRSRGSREGKRRTHSLLHLARDDKERASSIDEQQIDRALGIALFFSPFL
ncbi:hypothetical protein Ahy_B05g075858 [Arachis hypogaea]|uniref:Uncharacterized protein n=1 Tax=Arachis hypogaea TaxID=3818 RepID=A0A444Z252_ARAHY|nr:hypothetical protein Ahy_B05g075858 [Arachis hypogaea]